MHTATLLLEHQTWGSVGNLLTYAVGKGIRTCRLGSRTYADVVVRKEDPRGRAYYWIAGHQQSVTAEPDTDLVLSADGWTTVTPLLVDITDTRRLGQLKDLDRTW